MRKCSHTIEPEVIADIRATMAEEEEHINAFNDACVTTLKCEMCGNRKSDWVDAPHIAVQAYRDGWRFQHFKSNGRVSDEKMVLCQFCTDNKR